MYIITADSIKNLTLLLSLTLNGQGVLKQLEHNIMEIFLKNKIVFIILIFFLSSLSIYSLEKGIASNDLTGDLSSNGDDKSSNDNNDNNKEDEYDDIPKWIEDNLTISEQDDLYKKKDKKYQSRNYVESLKWRNKILFYVDEIDKFGFKRNINIQSWFPHIFIPYDGIKISNISLGSSTYDISAKNNNSFGLGLLYVYDNIANKNISLAFATSISQLGALYQHIHLEFIPPFLHDRLTFFSTVSLFDTTPLSYALKNFDSENTVEKMFNGFGQKFLMGLTNYNSLGLHFLLGGDVRVPLINININGFIENFYQHNFSIVDFIRGNDKYIAKERFLGTDFASINIGLGARWQKTKQTSTIVTGNDLSLKTKFIIPYYNTTNRPSFSFESKIEEQFTKKLFREFAVRARFILALNYNTSINYSHDPYIRGFTGEDLTGFFAFLGNLELLVPLLDVNIKQAVGNDLVKDAKFLIHFALFADGGFTIENYDYYLNTDFINDKRDENRYSKSFIQRIVDNYYIIPAITLGGGIRFYPYFLNFILRVDFGVNMIKTIMNRSAELEIVIKLNDLF